jgi:UDP-N-acetylmuramoylalanine--D-glutamate ligase
MASGVEQPDRTATPVGGVALVVGLGVAGASSARALAQRGWSVTATDDQLAPAAAERARVLADVGVTTVARPDDAELRALVAAADVVVPSPGVPYAHPALAGARSRGTRVWSEFELAARWAPDLPLVAVTGTNGKTTVTTLVAAMLQADGVRTAAVGNTDVPLLDVLDGTLDVAVVEASSFRLEFTETFAPAVAVWLNFAPDHLDWHPSLEHYRAAKAKVWSAQGPDDLAIASADDPVVAAAARGLRARVETVGLVSGDWRREGDDLVGPPGLLLPVAELARALPHDVTNALAAAAAASAAGAGVDAVRSVLRSFRGLPHRLALVGEHGGVRWYDDSKATVPAAAATAIAAFDTVVLIAGGRNKGLDLSPLAAEAGRVRHVVAIGEAADDVARAFAGPGSGSGSPAVTRAASMDEAVLVAAEAARPGDAVLLSPGCASFDWYGGYGERGDDFARAVAEHAGRTS